jgi:hypothetical protein
MQLIQVDKVPEPARSVLLLEEGTAALDAIDDELGLAFDDWDKQYYYNLFVCVSALLHAVWRSAMLFRLW